MDLRTKTYSWHAFAGLVIVLLVLTGLAPHPSPGLLSGAASWIDYDLHERGAIQVKLQEDLPIAAEQGRLRDLSPDGRYAAAIAALPPGTWAPLIETDRQTLELLHRSAEAAAGKEVANLGLFFRVTLPSGIDAAAALPAFMRAELVAGAYPIEKPNQPSLPPDYLTSNDGNFDSNSNTNIYQRYLDAAPDGIDARYAWEGNGGRGAGIDICNVEYGYNYHADLPPITDLALADKSYDADFYEHGTAVLGILGARDNGWGITGIAPEARLLFSPVHPAGGSFSVANAIVRCINALQMNAGDIILLEYQGSGRNGNFVPAEWDPAVYGAIQTAILKDMVVVAAAGNGGEDLDNNFYETARPGHAPFRLDKDSGSIIVGAGGSAWAGDPLTRRETSSYGATVDMQGWGQHVLAPGYGAYYDDEGDPLSYTLFSGTSSASPIVAAAAAVVQANYIAKNGEAATPAQVRQLLRDTGTPQENVNGENIGPLPDLRRAINDIWDFPAPAAPIISPPGGTYDMPLQVTIDYGDPSQNAGNTQIRYTLDGSEPTEDSFIFIPEQDDSLTLLYGAIVRVRAFSSDPLAGRVITSDNAAGYTSSTPKVATPQISPDGGSFNQGTSIVISTSTPDATIRYRTDGRTPSFFYPGTEYTGPITLPPGNYEIVARAYRDGYYKSDAAFSDEITINPLALPAPTIYPNSGDFAGEVTVYIGTTVLGATMRYTTDGSDPTASSPVFAEPFTLSSSATVKARIYLDGYTPSNVVSAQFDITEQVAAPVFNPASGSTANDSLQVSLATSTPGATIRYTTNGAEPTTYSTAYSGPFPLGVGQHTVKAKAFLAGAQPSNTVTANYTVYDTSVTIATPTIDPPGGVFNGPLTVTLSTDTEDVDLIFYTTDGTDPQSSPSVQSYDGPFQLAGDETYFLRVRAFKSGAGNSEMGRATLVVANPVPGQVVQNPEIDPPGGVFTDTVQVDVSAPDFSAPFRIRQLFVTTDGSDPLPDPNSPTYVSGGSTSLSIDSPQTIKALAIQAGWFDSDIVEAEFTFVCATPTISEGGTFVEETEVSISTTTSNATIYYTTDGSEPDMNSTVYNGAFSVSEDSVIKAICTRQDFEPSESAISVFLIEDAPVAPSIATQPQDQNVAACSDASFSVAVTGTAPLSYRWFKNGAPIAGADEPVLELASVRAVNAGSYSVTVENAAGEVSSQEAVLQVSGDESSCAEIGDAGDEYQVYLPFIQR